MTWWQRLRMCTAPLCECGQCRLLKTVWLCASAVCNSTVWRSGFLIWAGRPSTLWTGNCRRTYAHTNEAGKKWLPKTKHHSNFTRQSQDCRVLFLHSSHPTPPTLPKLLSPEKFDFYRLPAILLVCPWSASFVRLRNSISRKWAQQRNRHLDGFFVFFSFLFQTL